MEDFIIFYKMFLGLCGKLSLVWKDKGWANKVSYFFPWIQNWYVREMLKRKTHFRWTTCSSRRRWRRTPRTECSGCDPPAGKARPSLTSARPSRRSSGTGGPAPWVASFRLRRSSCRLSPSQSPTTTNWWRNCKYWPVLVLELSVSQLCLEMLTP